MPRVDIRRCYGGGQYEVKIDGCPTVVMAADRFLAISGELYGFCHQLSVLSYGIHKALREDDWLVEDGEGNFNPVFRLPDPKPDLLDRLLSLWRR